MSDLVICFVEDAGLTVREAAMLETNGGIASVTPHKDHVTFVRKVIRGQTFCVGRTML
jgi:hypothetical protein